MATAANRVVPVPARSKFIAPPQKRPSSKWLRWGMVAAVGLAVLGGVEWWRNYAQNRITYETVPVERGAVQARVTATGTLNAVVDVLVSSQVSGNIQALYADWNSKVKKGQLIALIDPEIFQAQLDQASATLHSAHSATAGAQSQLAKAEADLSAAQASRKSAEAVAAKDFANETDARSQWERYSQANEISQKKVGTNVVAQQVVDTAKASDEALRAQVEADKALVDAAQHNIWSAQASVHLAESQLAMAAAQEQQAKSAQQQAQINLDHTRIMAPVDGTVVARRMDVGQTVASALNPPTIFEIAQDLTKMQVDTNVDESDIGTVLLGQSASFVVDSYPGTAFEGVVADIRKAPIVTQNVVTYDVVITVDNPDLKLFPGMTANVTILTSKLEDALKVPNAVLRFRPAAAVLAKAGLTSASADKQVVYVLQGEKLKAVPVKFGLSDGKYTAVGSDDLRPGAQVVIKATAATAPAAAKTSTPLGPIR